MKFCSKTIFVQIFEEKKKKKFFRTTNISIYLPPQKLYFAARFAFDVYANTKGK